MWQFVAFLWLIEEVRGKEGEGMKCYAQEPRFTLTDVEVLRHFGIEVLDRLNGKEFVNEGTLLYAPFLPWALLLGDLLMGEGMPEVCVCNDVGESVEMLGMRIKHGITSIDSEGVALQEEDLRNCEKVGSAFLEGEECCCVSSL